MHANKQMSPFGDVLQIALQDVYKRQPIPMWLGMSSFIRIPSVIFLYQSAVMLIQPNSERSMPKSVMVEVLSLIHI